MWDKDNGLPGNYLNALYSDKRGGLWIDISEKGYFHFDIATGKTVKKTPPNNTSTNDNIYFTKPSEKKGIYEVFIIKAGMPSPHKLYEYKADSNFIIAGDPTAKKIIFFKKVWYRC